MRDSIAEHLKDHFEYLANRRKEYDAARNADVFSPETDARYIELHINSGKLMGYLEGLLETDEITELQFRGYMKMLNDITFNRKGGTEDE